jgi:hypothetical protein
VIIQVRQMPGPGQFAALQALLSVRPGSSPVLLRTPEGDVELGRSSVTPRDQESVSLALHSPVIVNYELDADDLARLASGLL